MYMLYGFKFNILNFDGVSNEHSINKKILACKIFMKIGKTNFLIKYADNDSLISVVKSYKNIRLWLWIIK